MPLLGPSVRAFGVLTLVGGLGCAMTARSPLPAATTRDVSAISEANVAPRHPVDVKVFSEPVPGGFAVGVHVQNRSQRAIIVGPDFGFEELEVFRAGDGDAATGTALRWEELATERRDEGDGDAAMTGALLRPGESLRLVEVIAASRDEVALEGTLALRVFPAARPSAVVVRRFRVEVPTPYEKPSAGPVASGSSNVEAGYVFASSGRHAIGVRVRNTGAAPVVLSAATWFLATSVSVPGGLPTLTRRHVGWSCIYAPVWTMCTGLGGVMLAPGAAVTVLDDANLCEAQLSGSVEVTYELGAPSLPCQGDVWLRGEFTAHAQRLE